MSNPNNAQVQNLLNTLSKKLGVSPENLKKSVQSGNISSSLKNLDPDEAKKIQEIISNKEASSKILSSNKAQDLMKKILGDKK